MSRRHLIFPAKVTLETFPKYYVHSHPTSSVLIRKIWALVMFSVNVSTHYRTALLLRPPPPPPPRGPLEPVCGTAVLARVRALQV